MTLQVLPPPQVTSELAPVVRLQSLVPVHWAVELFWVQVDRALHEVSQSAPQLPTQVVLLAQWVVHEVPQLMLQVLSLLQSKVTWLGSAPPSTSPPSGPTSPPSEQVPPVWQLQLRSVHEQAPVH